MHTHTLSPSLTHTLAHNILAVLTGRWLTWGKFKNVCSDCGGDVLAGWRFTCFCFSCPSLNLEFRSLMLLVTVDAGLRFSTTVPAPNAMQPPNQNAHHLAGRDSNTLRLYLCFRECLPRACVCVCVRARA